MDGTSFDFRAPHTTGERVAVSNSQVRLGGGYDHNWVLNGTPEDGMSRAARIHEPTTGRTPEVLTTEPGFPPAIHRPGEESRSRTGFKFGSER